MPREGGEGGSSGPVAGHVARAGCLWQGYLGKEEGSRERAAQDRVVDHDMCLAGRAGHEPVLIGGEMGERAAADFHVEIAPEDMAKLDNGRKDMRTREERILSELVIGHGKDMLQPVHGGADGGRFLLVGWSADGAPENGSCEAILGVGFAPFRPFVDLRAGGGVGGPEAVRATAGGKVAQDRAGFPDRGGAPSRITGIWRLGLRRARSSASSLPWR